MIQIGRFSGSVAGVGSAPRWALSFADLCLVLLAFLLLLQAHREHPRAVTEGMRAAFGSTAVQIFEEPAAPLFQPGEALLQPAIRRRFMAMGYAAATQGRDIHIESIGNDGGARRFDAWELAAARAASLARALQDGGLDPQHIDLAIDGSRTARVDKGQWLRVTIRRR